MAKFMIEVPHDPDTLGCARVVHVFLSTGSHFLANAEWGCRDGVHTAWMIVDADNKAEARLIVPPALRKDATIVGLNRFGIAEIEAIINEHPVHQVTA